MVINYTISFYRIASQSSFVEFCKLSDDKANPRGLQQLGRFQLESAWVQEVLFKFNATWEKSIAEIIADVKRPQIDHREIAEAWLLHHFPVTIQKASFVGIIFPYIILTFITEECFLGSRSVLGRKTDNFWAYAGGNFGTSMLSGCIESSNECIVHQ